MGYWLPEPRRAIIVLQVTVETNLPDQGIKELATGWVEYARDVCRGWADAGEVYEPGVLKVVGSGHYQLIPYGTFETGEALLKNHDEAQQRAAGLQPPSVETPTV